MLAADVPTRFPIPFADSAGSGFIRAIPEASQIGITAGAASLTDGFPPVTFLPLGAGGTPPWGQDFNGLLYQITQWCQWQAAGGPVVYDATFAAGPSGGYPKGAVLASATATGYSWLSTVDNNTSDPDAGGANWTLFSPLGGTYGDMKFRPTSEDLLSAGWVKANFTTIGNASSNATQLASALAANLFAWHWTNFSNTQCPVYTSAGVPTTRGLTAAADFAANRQIAVLDWRGAGPKGLDGMGNTAAGRYSGVTFASGDATTPGSIAGANTYALTTPQIPVHSHGVNDPGHGHGFNDPGHGHGLNSPGHVHGITDPQHNHVISAIIIGYGAGGLGALTLVGGVSGGTASSPTGISVNSATTGDTVNSNTTGASVNSNTTGITIQNAGSGSAHPIVDYSMMVTWYIRY